MDDLEQLVRDERWMQTWHLSFTGAYWYVWNHNEVIISGGQDTAIAAAQAALDTQKGNDG